MVAHAARGSVAHLHSVAPVFRDLYAWHDSSYLNPNNPVPSGNTISYWFDKTAKDRHLNQSTVAKRPIWLKDTPTVGHSIVRFDGVDDFMQYTGSDTNMPDMTDNFTQFVVCRPTVANVCVPVLLGDNATDSGWGLAPVGSDVTKMAWFRAGIAWHATSNAPNISSQIVYVTRRMNGMLTMWRSGNLAVLSTNAAPGKPINRITVGGHDTSTTTYLAPLDMSESLIYNRALTDDELNDVGAYLGAKHQCSWNNIATPATMHDLRFLYDAKTLVADNPGLVNGGEISIWKDGSGNGFDLTAPVTAGAKPKYLASAIGGLPVADFDGVSQELSRTATALTPSGNWTWFVVALFDTLSGTRGIVDADPNGGTRVSQVMRHNGTAFESVKTSGTITTEICGTALATVFQPHILEVVSTTSLEAINNGFTNGPTTITGTSPAATTITLGGRTGGAKMDGKIAYAAGYNAALSVAERAAIRYWLAQKFGISVLYLDTRDEIPHVDLHEEGSDDEKNIS